MTVNTDNAFRDVAERIAKVSAACLATAYAFGFLIVNISLSTYGIAMSGGDVIKAKYIYVGFLYLATLSICTLLFAVHFAVHPPLILEPTTKLKKPSLNTVRAVNRTSGMKPVRWVIVVMCLLIGVGARLTFVDRARYDDLLYHLNFELMLILSYQVMFAFDVFGSNTKKEWTRIQRFLLETLVAWAIVFAFVLPILTPRSWVSDIYSALICMAFAAAGIGATRWSAFFGKARPGVYESLMRSITVAIAFIAALELVFAAMMAYDSHPEAPSRSMFVVAIRHLRPVPVLMGNRLQHIYSNLSTPIIATFLSFAILHLIAYMTYRIEMGRSCSPDASPTQPSAIPMWIIRTVPMVVLVFISLQGFAHNIYDYIPVSRAGADYSTARISSFCLADPTRLAHPLTGSDISKEDRSVLSPSDHFRTVDDDASVGAGAVSCKGGILLRRRVIIEDNADGYNTARLDDYGPDKPEDDDVQPPHRLSLFDRQRQCAPLLWRHHRYLPSIETYNRADVLWIADEGSVSHMCHLSRQAAK
jgi:hypothetical protein